MNIAKELENSLLDYFIDSSILSIDESKAIGIIINRLQNDSDKIEREKELNFLLNSLKEENN